MLRIPVMSDSPSPIRAYSMPVAIPLRIWPASRLKGEGSEASDVLAGGVFLRERRCSGGGPDAEGEVVLYCAFGLSTQGEGVVRGLAWCAVDPRRASVAV